MTERERYLGVGVREWERIRVCSCERHTLHRERGKRDEQD